MRPVSQHTLYPERCDHCGRCVRVCPTGALKVGASYIAIDREICEGCDRCVEICDRDAIVVRTAPKSAAGRPAGPTDEPRAAVGSRAEAKALRKVVAVAQKPKAQHTGAGAVRWEFVDAAAIAAVMIAAMLGKNALLGLRVVELMPDAARSLTRALVLAIYYGVQLGAFAFLARRHKSGLLRAFGLRREKASGAEPASAVVSAALVGGLFLATEMFAIGYGLAVESMGWMQPHRLSNDLSSVFGSGGVGIALSAVLVALAAPFVEELAFRGVILPVLSRRMGMWGAILGSAAVYAAFHFSAWMFAPTMVLGIALGWLATTRRSLVPAIALHVLYNGAAVTAAFLLTR